MSEAKLQASPEGTGQSITVENCYAKVLEAYKARMTVGIALALVTVTLTGYAIQNKKPDLFFLTAAVPILALFVDLLTKYMVAVPFLYKAAVMEYAASEEEPASLLFLDYGKEENSRYRNILALPSGRERQRKFRAIYMRRGLVQKLILFGSAAIAEIGLGIVLY